MSFQKLYECDPQKIPSVASGIVEIRVSTLREKSSPGSRPGVSSSGKSS